MSAHSAVVERLEQMYPNDKKTAVRIANAVINTLDEGGWLTTADDHLALLRTIRKRIGTAVSAEETPARDLASLSRRLQDVSREIATLEEKERQETKGSSGGKSTGSASATAADAPLDSSQL